jgi:hypothetical protein
LRHIAHTSKDSDNIGSPAATFGHGCLYQEKGEPMSASKKRMLKTAALVAVLTGVMLGSSGCIAIELGGGRPVATNF